jgi:4-hydroxybutyrate dehydrogenase
MSTISYLTAVQFENGALRGLGGELRALGMVRPLIATDRGVERAGLLDRLLEAIGPVAEERLYADTPANPTEAAVDDAVRRYRAADCDGIVAFGGGSPMDLAKAVALKATHAGDLVHYAAASDGGDRITAAAAPLVAVPTTSGTGSEVGRATVIIMKDGHKRAVVSPFLVPRLAVCDPLLTLGLSRMVTAGTGMDAIAHCVETFLSPRINPPADAIALDGLARGAAWIGTACDDGGNADARWHMMMASLEGGLAFQKGLGAVHALSHALATVAAPVLHHGTLNAVLLPAVLRFNQPSAREKYARMRATLALPAETDLAQWFADLNRRLGLPPDLQAMGVARDIFPRMARMAALDFSTRTNPRPAAEHDYLALLEAAFDQSLTNASRA